MKPKVTFMPDKKTVAVFPGTTILNASRLAKINIRTRCGGNAKCTMCKVLIHDQSEISLVQPKEATMLGEQQKQGYRLACQAKVYGQTVVELPEDPLKAVIRKQLSSQNEEY